MVNAMSEKTILSIKKAAVWALTALGVLLAVKYIIPLFLPFLLAFFLAMLLEPIIERLRKKFNMKRGFATAFVVTLFLAVFLCGLSFAIYRLGSALSAWLRDIPESLSDFTLPTNDISQWLGRVVSTLPDNLAQPFQSMLDSLRQQASALPSRLYSRFFDIISSAASKAPSILVFILMLALGLYFISSGFPTVKNFLLRQLPRRLSARAGAIKSDVLSTIRGWGTAQLKLMGICFLELSAAFLIMRMEHALLIAAGVAIIDSLPVFGVGLVLIPWAVVSLLMGNYQQTLFIALTYAMVNLVRSCLEPKLLGQQMGLHPAATLMAVYAGYRVNGVAGMILFPISLMLLKQFNDRGWVRLWR